jgi:RNase H-like domain found in reverse transcriptase
VGYHSHTLNLAERGYDVHNQELLAVMRGLRQWRHLLLSSPFTTTVITDHANLQYYHQPQKINRHVARYLADLADYWFMLVHMSRERDVIQTVSLRYRLVTGLVIVACDLYDTDSF